MKPIDQLTDDEWLALVQRTIALPDVPPHLLQRALALWERRLGAPAQGPAAEAPLPRRWLAVLSFDSWAAAPMTAGMRALPSEVRQLLFSAEGCDIDLRVAPQDTAEGSGAGFSVSGQLMGPFTHGRIEIARAGDRPAGPAAYAALVQPLGEFRVDGIAVGSYRITVCLGDTEIELPPLDVGPAARGAA